MNRRIALALVPSLVFLVLVCLFPSREAQSQDIPSSYLESSTGYKAVTSPSIAITSAAATILGTIPVGCHWVEVFASGADVNFGPSNLGTQSWYPYIAAGAVKEFRGITSRNPTIYFRPRGSAGTATVGIIAR